MKLSGAGPPDPQKAKALDRARNHANPEGHSQPGSPPTPPPVPPRQRPGRSGPPVPRGAARRMGAPRVFPRCPGRPAALRWGQLEGGHPHEGADRDGRCAGGSGGDRRGRPALAPGGGRRARGRDRRLGAGRARLRDARAHRGPCRAGAGHAETALAAALARLEAHGLQATGHTCEGGPAEALPALAQRLAPDLLVLCAPVEGPFTPRPRADLAAIARHSWPGAILLLRPRQPRPADRV